MSQFITGAGVTKESLLANYYRWAEPDTDIAAYLKQETVDRLQLEVLRSLRESSHGPNEVGGILLGRMEFDGDRRETFVDDFELIGRGRSRDPLYTVTGNDESEFKKSLARHDTNPALNPVGYFRSHNRPGLFLSADDMRLIERHFPGPSNVFLLIKTLPRGACTAGFFFWKEGRIQSEFTDSEVPLMPVSIAAVEESSLDMEVVTAAGAQAVEAPAKGRGLRRLIIPALVTGVAAAVVVGVARYPERRPGKNRVQPHSIVTVPASTPAAIPPAVLVTQPPAASDPVTIAAAPARKDRPRVFVPPPVQKAPAAASSLAAEPPATLAAEVPRPVLPLGEGPIIPPAPTPPAPLPSAPAPSAATRLASADTFTGPRIVHQASPAVPRGVGPMITGDVEVNIAVSIDAEGKVTDARVASTKGVAAGLLTLSAIKAAESFRFQPALANGRNVSSSMVLTFRFVPPAKQKE